MKEETHALECGILSLIFRLKKEIYVGNKVVSSAMAYIHREHENGFPEANPHYTNAKTFKVKNKNNNSKRPSKKFLLKKKKTNSSSF